MSGSGILQMLPGYEGGNLIWPVPDPMGRSLRKYRRVRDQIETLVDSDVCANDRLSRPAQATDSRSPESARMPGQPTRALRNLHAIGAIASNSFQLGY